MPATAPFAIVKEKYGDKAKLVSTLEKLAGDDLWIARTNEGKGLGRVSNAKLLKLLATFTEVKEKFGTREKLVASVLEVEGRSKDTGLRQKMSTWPVTRLYDAYKAGSKRAGARKAQKAAPAAAVKKPAAKKATPGSAAKKPATK